MLMVRMCTMSLEAGVLFGWSGCARLWICEPVVSLAGLTLMTQRSLPTANGYAVGRDFGHHPEMAKPTAMDLYTQLNPTLKKPYPNVNP